MHIKGGQLQNLESGEKNHTTFDHMDEGKNKSSFTGQPGKLKSSHQGQVQILQLGHKGGDKLETDESSIKISNFAAEAERFGNLGTTKGKKMENNS
ncbi:hypothetical protein GQ457_10G018360 [Hibiscus cannabinus]